MERRRQQPGGQYEFSKKEEVIFTKASFVILMAVVSLFLEVYFMAL